MTTSLGRGQGHPAAIEEKAWFEWRDRGPRNVGTPHGSLTNPNGAAGRVGIPRGLRDLPRQLEGHSPWPSTDLGAAGRERGREGHAVGRGGGSAGGSLGGCPSPKGTRTQTLKIQPCRPHTCPSPHFTRRVTKRACRRLASTGQ